MNDNPSAPTPAPAPSVEADCRPQVALPRAGVPVWALGVAAGAIGLAMLLTLNANRATLAVAMPERSYVAPPAPALPRDLAASPGDLFGSAAPPARPRYALVEGPSGPPAFSEPVRWSSTRGAVAGPPPFAAPMPAAPLPSRGYSEGGRTGMTFPTEPMPGAPVPGGGFGGSPRAATGGGTAIVYDSGRSGSSSADDKGAGDAAARATIIRNRAAVVAQGELLPATLETPINSTRPGPIRAVVARDVRAFDGTRVLIPRGSRLVGEYRADPAPGKRRILATWTRIIRPDGVAIRIDSPATDALGGTGIPGRVDTHFLARFANATLQSALQIGVNLAARARNGSIIIGNTTPVTGVTGQTIIPGADDPPTVSVRAGAPIAVFVARDLDFTGVPVTR